MFTSIKALFDGQQASNRLLTCSPILTLATRVLPVVTLLLCVPSPVHTQGAKGGQKITICHVPPGNPENPRTITVSESALPAHLAHGDFIGTCGAPPSGTGPTLDPVVSPTAATTVLLSGVSLRQGSVIRIEGGLQTVETPSAADRSFSAVIPLHLDRLNRIFVTELFPDGSLSPVVGVDVIQDGQPPKLFIDFPPDGAQLTAASTDVAGRVSDLLSGFGGLTVTVNGVPAEVNIGIGTNGTFLARDVPLDPLAPTVLSAIATDSVGNSAAAQVTVQGITIPAGDPFMQVLDGNGQVGNVDQLLPNQLSVQVFQGDGSAFAGKLVNFRVTRSNGRLSVDGNPPGSMLFQAMTDASGIARAFLTLGSDAGCGNNRVAVTSQDIAGTVFFCASANAGPAAQINVGSGNEQRTEAGGPALKPLRVWVSDSCNGVQGVPVTFTVIRGGGQVEGLTMFTVVTGPTGHAEVGFVLGATPGNNLVRATFPDNTGNPASFHLVGVVRDTNQPTSLSGTVLDNGNQPVQGAVCSLEVQGVVVGTETSDIDGRFRFADTVLSGPGHLHVDGLQATHVGGAGGVPVPVGSFPALSYEIVLVPNAKNSLPRPVLLPPLDPVNARSYDGTHDVHLTVAGIDGLEMIVRAGSMTRADGTVPSPSDPAILALNQVHHDKVPMPMPDGAAPPFAWTLQPAGAMFDPPVEISYPNMSGLPSGAIAYFLSFDHETGRFEIIGSGQVSPDGSSIVSDPGVGIFTAGWGCNCPPYAITEDCKKCNVEVTGPEVACVGEQVEYTAKVSGDGELMWSVTGGGANPTTQTVSVTDGGSYTFSTTFNTPGKAGGKDEPGIKVEANLSCTEGNLSDQHGVGVTVAKVEFDPAKVNVANEPSYAGAITKTKAVEWDSSEEVDAFPFLVQDLVKPEVLTWFLNGTEQESSVMSYGNEPAANQVTVLEVRAELTDCPADTPGRSDQMFIVIYPAATKTNYDMWKMTYSGSDAWLGELPPVYCATVNTFLDDHSDPEPSSCNPQRWQGPSDALFFAGDYHPGADADMRSQPTAGNHGHQATYASNNMLITSQAGFAAGTADFVHPDESIGTMTHGSEDVLPFMWAVQLDGNPVVQTNFGASLSRPLMYRGAESNAYFTRRPTAAASTIPANQCNPGPCN